MTPLLAIHYGACSAFTPLVCMCNLRQSNQYISLDIMFKAYAAYFTLSRVFLLIVLNKQEDRDVIQQLGP